MSTATQDKQDPKRLLITINEAARRLSIGRSHIYDQMQRGALRSIHIGRSRRILESDLDEFIDQLLQETGAHLLAGQPGVKGLPLRSGRR